MCSYQELKLGITKYLENELVNKVGGWQKWVLAAGLNKIMENSTHVFNTLKQHPFIKMMDVIDEQDMIDIDAIYNAILPEAQKSAATFNVPMLGAITLRADDVEKLYRYIKG